MEFKTGRRMDAKALQQKLCLGVEPTTKGDEFQKIKKVLAPFLRTMKRRKRIKTDVVADEHRELYLKNNPKELLTRLQDSYTDPLRIKTLLNETGELLKSVTKSTCFNLYLTDYDRGEIVMVSEFVEENERFEQRYPIETGTYLAAYVAYTKEYVISNDILGDVRFANGIPFAGPTVKAAICIPIITNVQDNCIGVLELFRDNSSQPYNLINLQICSALTAWLGIAVEQNAARLNLTKEVDIHKEISVLSNLYFGQALSFGKLLSDVLKILKITVSAEKGGFYVFQETVPFGSEDTLLADAYEEGFDNSEQSVLFKKRKKLRFVKDQPGLVGYAARRGEIFNIRDAYKDSRFDRKYDPPSFRTRSLLCFPIKSSHGVVAVLKLVNKQGYPYFRKEDVELLEPHMKDLGLVCQHYELDVAFSKLNLRMTISEKLLDCVTKSSPEEISQLKSNIQIDSSLPLGFHRFDWDTTMFEEESLRLIVCALISSDMFETYFEPNSMLDFLIRVKKGHRSVLYHNFEHVFSVFHCVFLILNKNKDVFTPVEIVSLVLAALCHDIDHTGVTNSFTMLKNDPTFQLYEDFCGEVHRFDVTMILLKASNVLMKFSSSNYQAIVKNLKNLMISLDLSVYFQNRMQIIELINSNSFSWTEPEHRFLALSMILMSAENCFTFKSFEIVKKFTANFYKELQHQGDLERAMEFEPLTMLDRSKSDSIPENQITLINVIVMPVLQIISTLLPNLASLCDLVNQTLEKWKEIVTMRGQEMWKMNQAMVKDKRDRRSQRVSVSRSSSIKTFSSEK